MSLVDGRVSVANWTIVRGFLISSVVIIVVGLGGSCEWWITGSQSLARSPIHDGQYEGCRPENETQPKKYGSSSFGVAPVGQSVFETVITIPGVRVFLGVLTPGLRPGRNCRNEARAGGCLERGRDRERRDIRD